MLYTDGECPLCPTQNLRLNCDDLFECPECRLQISMADQLFATVMKPLGGGEFRPANTAAVAINGAVLAPSLEGGVLPNVAQMFSGIDAISQFLASD